MKRKESDIMSTLTLKKNNTVLLKDENKFLDLVKNVYEKITGHESYGEITEYYDEDGVVLMTTREEDGHVNFQFTEGEEQFEYVAKEGFDLTNLEDI